MRNMRKILQKLLSALLAPVVLLAGCGGAAATSADRTVFAMDTVMSLRVYGGRETLDAAEAVIRDLEGKLSVTDPDSEIYAVNRDGAGAVSPDTAALLARALSLCAETGGALDLSIYPVSLAWGFTSGEYDVPGREDLDALLESVDYTRVALDTEAGTAALAPGMKIDLGAVAKGYAGDRLAEVLQARGVTSALLDLGGNVVAIGAKPEGAPWRVGVQDPTGDGLAGVLEVVSKTVVTSGGYERYFERDGVRYWHILDPATGEPARSGLSSVTVVGTEGVFCDACSTALFVLGLEKAAEFWRAREGFELVLIDDGGNLFVTEGLENSFTPAGDYANSELTILRRNET